MKIRKVLDKKVGNTEYSKYLITLPKKIEETNLLDKELELSLLDNKIIIEIKSNKIHKKKLTDKENKIQKELLKLINMSI